jgi:hypothetical protein
MHSQGVTGLALVAMFVVLDTAPFGTAWYLAWMGLPLLVLGFQHGADDLAKDVAGERASDGQLISMAMYVACAILIIQLTAESIGRDPMAPIWIAAWASAGLLAAKFWTSRGLFVTGYVILVAGYAVHLNPGDTLSVWWAGLIVTAVPFAIAIALDRRLDDEVSRETPNRWMAGLTLTFIPYAMGLSLLTAYAFAHFPHDSALLASALVGLALVLSADRLSVTRGVASVVVATVAWNLMVVFGARALAGPAAALLPLLLFAAGTLAIERVVHAWVTEARDHPLRASTLAGLVVLATLSAVSAIYYSELIGATWATAGWSVLGGSMMAFGFAAKSAIHRRVALLLLGSCIIRVFVVDTIGLSDTARIGAFLVLGLILLAISLLYTRFSEELKSWL